MKQSQGTNISQYKSGFEVGFCVTTTEEEQSSLKRLEETIPELFQCVVVRQMGIDLFI